MTYRKRVRSAAKTDGTHGPDTAHTSSLSEEASQPTKKHATEPQLSQVSSITTTVKFGPFSPQGTLTSVVAPPCSSTSKSALQTEDILGAIWKRPPTSLPSSSLMEATKDKFLPKLSSTISPEVPTSIPPSNTSKSQKHPSTSSGHVPPHISPVSHISPNMPPNMPPIIPPSTHIKPSSRASQNNQQQNNNEKPKENSTKSKSLRVKSYPDWPVDIDFDDKEEVLTIDAKRNA
ncbi:uncharacterized protein [Spinacia oleracea]|uniref:Uncharacterized protein n=1 Tax=Spinacia oleracea TaxID=3562 RepID=A0ABM3QZ87_SPIOL|nr:uncharacterized protein LOC130463534 [Spinacia oleracea]